MLPIHTVLFLTLLLSSLSEALFFANYRRKKQEKKEGKINFALENEHKSHLNERFSVHPANGYRVVTFNIEAMKKPDYVIATLLQTQADIIVLQEIKRSHFPMMEALFTEYPNRQHCLALRPNGYVGNMILSKFRIANFFTEQLDDKMGGFLKRCYVMVTIQHPASMQPITVFGTHLRFGTDDKSQIKRLEELNIILQAAAKVNHHDTIITGDFNMDLSNRQLIRFVDAFKIAKEKYEVQNTQWRGHRIDFILVRPNMNVLKAGNWFTGASDHLPQVADIAFPPREGRQQPVRPMIQSGAANAPLRQGVMPNAVAAVAA